MPRSDPELKRLNRRMRKVLEITPDSADDIDEVQVKFDKLRADEEKFRQNAAKKYFNSKKLTYPEDMKRDENLLKKRRDALLRRVAKLEKAAGKKPSTKKSQGRHSVIRSEFGPGVNSMRSLNRTLRNARRKSTSGRSRSKRGRSRSSSSSGTYSSWTKL